MDLTRLKQNDKLVIKYDKAANHTYTIAIAETCEMHLKKVQI